MRRFVVVTAVALLAAVSSASGAPVSHRVDLANGTLDGHRVLGLTVPQVEAALGRPDFRTGHGLCSGEFGAADTSVHLTFGSTTTRGTFITVWKTLA